MKKVLRIIIALVFITSGFVKAIDPVGFSFKLEEYFGAGVFNMPFLEKLSLPIAIFVSSAELLLGVMLLFKIKIRQTLIALIALCVFFAFLTFYSAWFNVVTDCGCFGDAVKLTPWQSFWKDIALLAGLILLRKFYRNENSGNNLIKKLALIITLLTMAFIVFWGISHEPLIDFRDYKTGTDLKLEKQKIAASPSEFKTFYFLKNNTTGEEKKVNQDEYIADQNLWKEGSPWEIQKDKTTSEITKQGYASEISKFKITGENGEDLTEQILNSPKSYLVFSYKPEVLNQDEITEAESKILSKPGLKIGISTFEKLFSKIPNATMDGTAIKTIARSNPFVLVLENGKIIEKTPLKDFK